MQQPAAYALSDRQVDVETPEHVSVGYELADLGSRFTAMLVDGLAIMGMQLVLFLGMLAVASLFSISGLLSGASFGVGMAIAVLFSFAIFWGYYVYFEGFRDG